MKASTNKSTVLVALACGLLGLAGCGGSQDTEPVRDPIPAAAARVLQQAQDAYNRGELSSAAALADSSARLAPDRAEIHFLQGLIYRDLNRFDDAEEALQKVLALSPEYRSVRFNLGQTAFLRSAYREALRWYREEEQHLRRDRREARSPSGRESLAVVLAQIGRSYAALGVPDSARLAYNGAIEADSTNASAHAWLAELDRDADQFDEALKHARKSLVLQPRATEYNVLLGTILLRSGNPDAALKPLRDAASKQPWNRVAIYNLGRALQSLGRTEEASTYLARADTLEEIWGDLGLLLRGIQLHPDDATRWEEYAFLLNQAGNRAEAWKAARVARYLRSERQPPDSTAARDL